MVIMSGYSSEAASNSVVNLHGVGLLNSNHRSSQAKLSR